MIKFINRFVASASLLALLASPGYSSNDNNESLEAYNARIALQQQQAAQQAESNFSSPLALVAQNPSSVLSTDTAPQHVSFASGVLSLRSSLKLQGACRLLMTPTAGEELNNLCTNLAYEQALVLYAKHGDRFVEPFTKYIHDFIFGMVESSIKKATGTDALFKAIKTLTGINLTSAHHVTEITNTKLSQSVIDVLRLKFVTDLANKHVVGPYVVAPNVASAVNQINFGRIIQDQVFARINNLLLGIQDELVDISVKELKEYAQEIVKLQEALKDARANLAPDNSEAVKAQLDALKAEIEQLNKDARAELSWTDVFNPVRSRTEKELQVAQKVQEQVELENSLKARQDQLDQIKKIESDIEALMAKGRATAQALIAVGRYNERGQIKEDDRVEANKLLAPDFSLAALFGDVPFIGGTIDRYLSPCPHIQPGYLSSLMTSKYVSLVASVPRGYLRLTGVTGSINNLREDLSQDTLTRVYTDTLGKLNNVRQSATQLSETRFAPIPDELEGQGSIQAGATRFIAFLRGSRTALQHTTLMISEGTSLQQPVVGHVRRIQEHAHEGSRNLQLALAPAHITYNTLVNAGQIWAVNYVLQLAVGAPVNTYVYTPALAIALFQQLYILLLFLR